MTDDREATPGQEDPVIAQEPRAGAPRWWRSEWFTALAVVLVFPLGLVLLWTRRPGWGRDTNALVTGAVAIIVTLVVSEVVRTPEFLVGSGPRAALTSPSASGGGLSTTASSPLAQAQPKPRTTPGGKGGSTSLPGFRNPLYWPFSITSIWNMPIGAQATYIAAGIAPATVRTVQTDQDVIVMVPNAPLTPIAYNGAGWSGGSRCAAGSTLATAPIPSGLIVPGSTGNYAFAVLMPNGHTVLQGQPLARCTAGGAATTMDIAPPADLFTDGIRGGHGGSGLSSLGGTIRLGELVPGAPPIRHVLKVDLDGSADYWPLGFRWPAVKEDGYGPQRYGGKVPALRMGALLALPASLNLASLNLQTVPGRMIAWTLQNYGAYCVDDAGRSVYSIATETGPQGSVVNQFQADWGFPFVTGVDNSPWARDMATIFSHLAVVDNNSPSTIGGPGGRLQPYAPPLS